MRKAEKAKRPLAEDHARSRDVDRQRDLKAEAPEHATTGHTGASKNVSSAGTQGTHGKDAPPRRGGTGEARERD